VLSFVNQFSIADFRFPHPYLTVTSLVCHIRGIHIYGVFTLTLSRNVPPPRHSTQTKKVRSWKQVSHRGNSP